MKRALSLALSVLLIVMMIPLGVFVVSAATSGTTGDCTWTLDGTQLTISGKGKMGEYDVGAAPWGHSITSVMIENGVTSIGGHAFSDCTSLASVTIPVSVTTIGGFAFNYCTSLTSVTIPDSVTFIDYGTFCYCKNLASVTIPNSVTIIGRQAFYGCTDLTSVTIPDSVTQICTSAFRDCSSLTSVTIGNGVELIEERAFWGTGIKRILIPKNVTNILDSAVFESDVIIQGYKGSCAERYATAAALVFEAVDETPASSTWLPPLPKAYPRRATRRARR